MPRADPIHVVETCYRLEGAPEDWLRRVTEAMLPILDRGLGAHGLVVRRLQWGQLEITHEAFFSPPETRQFVHHAFANGPPEYGEHQFRRTPPVDVAHETMERLGGEAEALYRSWNPPGCRMVDHVTLIGRDGSDEAPGFCAMSEQRLDIRRRTRARYRMLLAHVKTAWRLLQAPQGAVEEAVLAPDGRCLHAVHGAKRRDAREALRDAARRLDRVRGPLRRQDPDEALAIWKGLVRGRWSLVDRFEADGRRYVVAHRNDAQYDDPRKLSAREQQCARLAAVGSTHAEIGYALGLSAMTVGRHVHGALRKLGLQRRQQLADVLEPAPLVDTRVTRIDAEGALRVVSAPSAAEIPTAAGLTEAEHAVARALLEGASVREIARRRGSAERTVINQMQRVYRKLGVRSRTELAARLRSR